MHLCHVIVSRYSTTYTTTTNNITHHCNISHQCDSHFEFGGVDIPSCSECIFSGGYISKTKSPALPIPDLSVLHLFLSTLTFSQWNGCSLSVRQVCALANCILLSMIGKSSRWLMALQNVSLVHSKIASICFLKPSYLCGTEC